MDRSSPTFERRQADLLKVVFAMVAMAIAMIGLHHDDVAMAGAGLGVAALALWLVRRVRYAQKS